MATVCDQSAGNLSNTFEHVIYPVVKSKLNQIAVYVTMNITAQQVSDLASFPGLPPQHPFLILITSLNDRVGFCPSLWSS